MFKFQNDKNATVRSIAKELNVRPSTVYSTYCNINEYAKLYEEISNKLDNITSIQELLNKLNDKLELNNKITLGDLKYTAYRLGNLSYIAKLLGRNLNKLEQNLFTIIKYSNNKSISDLVKENKLESSTNNKKKVSKQELLELYLRGDSIAREFMKQ